MQDIKLAVHAHPTLSEVVDELFKAAKVKYKNLHLHSLINRHRISIKRQATPVYINFRSIVQLQ